MIKENSIKWIISIGFILSGLLFTVVGIMVFIGSLNFKNNAILFSKALVSSNVFSEDEITTQLLDKQGALKNADIIVINDRETDTVFQILNKLSKSENIDLSNKEIFVINNTNKHFMKRVLSKYVMLINNDNIYMVNDDHLLNLISDLSFGKDIKTESLIEVFPLSFEQTSKWM
jgi:hypothetical protein